MRIKCILFAILILSCAIWADEWKVFSQPLPVYSAIPYEKGYVLATGGGIQFSTPKVNRLFTSADGLGATAFFAVAQTSSKIYGISEYGLVVSYDKASSRWEVVNRSYLSNKVKVVPGQVLIESNNLVVAFENRLAFFDINQNAFLLTIEKIGGVSLVNASPQKISIVGDSLFVLLGAEVYGRKMEWNNMSKDMRLADPSSWNKVAVGQKAEKYFQLTDREFDNIKRDSVYNNYSLGNTYNFTPTSNGGVVAASPEGWMAYSDGYNWQNPVPIWYGESNIIEAYDNRMKVLSALDDGLLLAHVWGKGFFLYKDNGYTLVKAFTPRDEDSGLDEIIDHFTVAVGTTVAPDGSGFLVATAAKGKYGLAYISTRDGNISFAKDAGSLSMAGTLIAKKDEKNGDWIVYVSARDGFAASSEGSLDVFRIVPPSQNGGRLVVSDRKNIPTPEGKSPLDFAFDKDDGSLWMITVGNFAYMEKDKDTLIRPSSTKGLLGAEYSSIDRDVQGNIWLGTADQGVFRLTKRKKSKDTLTVNHFTMKDGLLSDHVHDLVIDSVLGMAWFAHEGGVTRYSRKDLRSAEKMMTSEAPAEVKAYPNPFRPKQGQRLIIDNISEDSFVSVYNRGGMLVKSFYDSDVLGGRVEWDGNDRTGKLVAPGVYHYVVRKGSKKKTGKIILIH